MSGTGQEDLQDQRIGSLDPGVIILTKETLSVQHVLKAERVLNTRLRKLIVTSYLKLGGVWQYKWSCTGSEVVVATMNL